MYALFVIIPLIVGFVIGWLFSGGWLIAGLIATLYTILINQEKKDIQNNMIQNGVCK